jgi:hypothetical protein
MQNAANKDYLTPEGFKLRFYQEETEEVSLKVPAETMKVLQTVADSREIPVEALIRMFIGQGLRDDLTENFPGLAKELFERRFRNRKKGSKSEDVTEVDLAA